MQTIFARARLLAVCVGVCLSSATDARTTAVIELTCPIGGEVFTTRVERAGEATCRRFDFKRVGPVDEPPTMPVCPNNGFVMFSEQIPSEEVDKITPWIESDTYQQEVRHHAPYYRIARMLEFLGKNTDLVGWYYLQASWQVEATDPVAYTAYVKAAIAEFDAYVASPPPGPPTGLGASTAQFLAAELSRRLGDFTAARTRFEKLQASPHPPTDPIVLAIRTQLHLVAQRDNRAHAATWNADPARCEALIQRQAPATASASALE